jgi:hypothetical protein
MASRYLKWNDLHIEVYSTLLIRSKVIKGGKNRGTEEQNDDLTSLNFLSREIG